MRAVMMESLTSDVDAYRAGLASILDLDLDVFPAFDGINGPVQWDAWAAVTLNATMMRLQPAAQEPPGYWLARLVSPYQPYQVHTVVAGAGRVVHDPHPEQQGEFTLWDGLIVMELLVPIDPSLPFGRFAVDS